MDFKKAKSKVYKYEQNVIGREKIPETLVRNMIFGMLALRVDRSLSDLDDRLAFIADGISRMLYRGVLYLWAGSLISDAIGGSL